MNRVAIALGGNSGSEKEYFTEAVRRLAESGLTEIRMSSFYKNPAVGCIPDTPDFTNAVLTGLTSLSPEQLLEACRKIEVDLGRPSNHRSDMSRTIDIDIILFDELVISKDRLIIPHPRAHLRDFVMVPLAEIAGEWPFPGYGMTVNAVLGRLKESNSRMMKKVSG